MEAEAQMVVVSEVQKFPMAAAGVILFSSTGSK